MADASKSLDTVFVIFGSANMPQTQQQFSLKCGENLQRQTSAKTLKYFYYGNEPTEFKSKLFRVWVERSNAHVVPEENLVKSEVYDANSAANEVVKFFSLDELQF